MQPRLWAITLWHEQQKQHCRCAPTYGGHTSDTWQLWWATIHCHQHPTPQSRGASAEVNISHSKKSFYFRRLSCTEGFGLYPVLAIVPKLPLDSGLFCNADSNWREQLRYLTSPTADSLQCSMQHCSTILPHYWGSVRTTHCYSCQDISTWNKTANWLPV